MEDVELVLGLILLSIGARLCAMFPHRRFLTCAPVGDAITYYQLITYYQQKNRKSYDERCLMGTDAINVPNWYQRICAVLFSKELLFKKPFLPNLLFFVASVLIFFLVIGINPSAIFGNDVVNVSILVTALVFMLSLNNVNFDEESIHFLTLAPRFLGKVSASFTVFFTWLYMINDGIHWFVFAVIFTIISLMSSLFARQAVLFLLIVWSILSMTFAPVLVLFLSVVVCFFVFGKEFVPSVKGHYDFSINWVHRDLVYRTKLSEIFTRHFLKTNPPKEVIRELFDGRVLRIAYFPEVLILVAFLFASDGVGSDIKYQLFVPVLSALVIWFVTSLRKYAFLGEGYRYITFTQYFYLPFAIGYLTPYVNETFTYVVLCAFFLYVAIITTYKLFHKASWIVTDGEDKLSEFLDKFPLPTDAIIYSVHYRVGEEVLARGYGAKSFAYQQGNHGKEINDKYFEEYPYLKIDWKPLFKEYNVTHVIVEKESLMGIGLKYDYSGLNLVGESDYYILYEVPKSYATS